VCPEVLSANQEVEGLRELLKQLDVLRAKSRSVAVTEPVKLARGPLVELPDRDRRRQEGAREKTRKLRRLEATS
jgi:hypothetical protein